MDYSSPLSSPPASSVLDGNESDGDRDIGFDVDRDIGFDVDRDAERDVDHDAGRDCAAPVVPDEASSEIDLVLMSPQVTPPPPVLPQRASRTSPGKSAKPARRPQQAATKVITETATETVAQADEADDVPITGEDAPNKVENENEAMSLNEPANEPVNEPVNEPGDAIVVAVEIHALPLYTANTFAVARSPSPKPKRAPKRRGKRKHETAVATETADTEEAPVQRSRARSKKESEPPPPSRTPRKAARKAPTTVEDDDDNNDDDNNDNDDDDDDDDDYVGRPKAEAQTEADPEPAMPAVTTTRSGRRVVQTHYGDDSSPPSAKRASTRTPAKTPTKPLAKTVKASPSNSAAAAVMRRRKQAAARWRTDFVLANTRSPLAHFDLRTLLCQPEAWDALDAEEKKEVLALLPPSAVVVDAGTVDARPDIASLKNDNNFRHDCARYRSDLQAGFYNKQWLEEAFEAHAMRAEGLFHAHVLEAFESSWGVAVPDEHKPESMRQREEVETEVKDAKEVKDVPKTSLKRSRRPSTKAEEKTKTEVNNGGDDTTADAKTKNEIDEQRGTEPIEANTEPEKRSPKRQKQTDENKDEDNKNDKEVEAAALDQREESQARFALILDSPVQEEDIEDKHEVVDKGEVTMNTAMATVEEAPIIIPAKRKASVDIIDTVDVPMRSRKRMTPSIGIAGEAQGQEDGDVLEDTIEVGE